MYKVIKKDDVKKIFGALEKELKNTKWVKITAKIEVAFSQMYNKQGTIFHVQSITDGDEPEDKLVYFN